MIKETFIALKNIGVKDEHVLDVIVAIEARHEEHRRNFDLMGEKMHDIKNDVHLLKWVVGVAAPVFFGLLVTILFKLFTR